ncbi:SusC/RagA family TonB-linked outer membrane protein [Pseudobacter ginsenosidimutans]|nr:SusC/RagA family TonB-linked outer membrane protein [Pseudobacter ginsenosidimutans]
MMKLIILLTTAFVFKVHGAAHSQTITYSGKNIALKQLIEEVQKQTGYLFFYNTATLNGVKPVTVNVHEEPLSTFLDTIFLYQPLTYSIRNKTIFLRRRPLADDPFVTAINNALFGAIDVKGKVFGQNNEPLAGATISVKGKNRASQSDDNGNFELKGIDNNAVLLVTAVNYQSQELPVSNRTELLIKLTIKPAALEQVIISNGYQDIPQERSTGSFEVIRKEELNRKVGPDLISRLEGVSGIFFDRRINHPGRLDAEDGVKMNIRGLTTFSNEYDGPLIILNNFPFNGDIRSINPNDVESVTILRDAAAASVWGAQSANGVIVINTKKGKYNQPMEVNLTSTSSRTRKPELHSLSFAGASDYIDLEIFLFDKGYYNSNLRSSRFPGVSEVVEILALKRQGAITGEEAKTKIDKLRARDVRGEFEDLFYRDAISHQVGLDVTGGSDKIKYNLSGNIDYLPTYLKREERTRYNFSTTHTYRPIKNLTTSLDIRFNRIVDHPNGAGDMNAGFFKQGSYYLPPYFSFLDENGHSASSPYQYREPFTDTIGGGRYLHWKYRPLDEARSQNYSKTGKEFLVNWQISWQPLPGFTTSFFYQYGNANHLYTILRDLDSYYTRNLINNFTNLDEANPAKRYPVPIGGIRSDTRSESTQKNYRFQLQFSRFFGKKHEVDAQASAEASEHKSFNQSSVLYGYNAETMQSLPVDNATLYETRADGMQRIPGGNALSTFLNRNVNVVANASYQYDKRYIFTLSGRRDAANIFGVTTNAKWTPFWSGGFGWKISNEKFFKLPYVDQLHTSISFGYRGNVNPRLSAQTIITHEGNSWTDFGLNYASIKAPANPQLKWEKLATLNFKTDMAFLQNRINIVFETFRNKAQDVIHYVQIDATTGVIRVEKNFAGIASRGINLAIRTQNLKGVFKWSTEISVNTIRNKIEKIDTLRYPTPKTARAAINMTMPLALGIGYDPYSIISFRSAGLDPQTGDPMGLVNGKPSRDYQAINDQPVDSAIQIHGSSVPRIHGYFNNLFTYRNFHLLVGIQFKLKYYYQRDALNYGNILRSGLLHTDYLKRWKQPGDEKTTTVPSQIYPASTDRDFFYTNSSVNIQPADNIQFSNIQFGYTWEPQKNLKKIMRALTMNVNLENLGFLWLANDEKTDPNIPPVSGSYQTPVRISGQIRLTF